MMKRRQWLRSCHAAFGRAAPALIAVAVSLALGLGVPAWATTTYVYSGTGDWEDTGNWDLGVMPGLDAEVKIEGDADVTFDDDSWTALSGAGLLHSPTEYRYETTRIAGAGTDSATFNFDNANIVRMINSRLSYIGSGGGSNGTMNLQSGQFINETSTLAIAEKDGSTGLLDVSGGTYIVGRESGGNSLNLGTPTGAGTQGTLAISGGTLLTRAGLTLGGNGVFDVQGSGVAQIGIGSQGSVDGRWIHAPGGVLRAGVDAGGITPILVDDYDDNGSGGNASFLSGSLLDPYDLGGAATGVWHTVMMYDGPLIDLGLGLTPAAASAGWQFRFVSTGSGELQVLLVPEPTSLGLLTLGGLLLFSRRRK